MAKLTKFGFGGIGFKVKRNTIMPGVNRTWLGGERFVVPALFDESLTYTYEFGEIVEIVGDTDTNYIVKPITAETLETAKLGVIMHEITGAQNIRDGLISNGVPNVTLNVWLLDRNLGGIGVAVKGATAPKIGDKVHVGNGTNGTVAGVAYAAAVTNGTIDTNLVFKSVATAPTETTALSAEIGVAL